ncbi:MAG: monovalent cation/H+ antiporter subunit D, partial [Gammaproteobacteria bacterium]|nr:monovalent cation/H+ antiporter subunit D [Gammaproteobacteria bacterium]MBU1556036.1 monovalent cation/H+ antiporter subunit D [Gammaproteobacteria bacterium]
HSTLVTGALFLVADLIASQRGKAADRLVSGRRVAQPVLLGVMFVLAALSVAGLPPMSGFIGKLMLLQAVQQPLQQMWIWSLVLLSSLMVIVGLSRAGSSLFWRVSGNDCGTEKAEPLQIFAVCWLLAASPLLVIFAGPLTELAQQAAMQLHDVSSAVNLIIAPGNTGSAP